MDEVAQLVEALAQHGAAVLVRVDAVRGSVPREVGAWVAVWPHTVLGTVGGGHLEWQALARARALLAQGVFSPLCERFALGPRLGQCCGGEVHLCFEPVVGADAPRLRQMLALAAMPVALFGGGHVGRAIVQALAPLPVRLHWLDSREGVFPGDVPGNALCEHSEPVQAAVPGLAPGSRVLIMSFSHAEDLDIVAACLRRQRVHGDLPFIGLIGSRTKWAAFASRLRARGFSDAELAQVTCPIGVPGIHDKRPAVIAVAVAAQLMQQLPHPADGGLPPGCSA
ncbi:MAG: xanthine dehydrogenase accessory protein XdhC [Rhodoferax sp.]